MNECAECGERLSEQDRFCMACGQPTGDLVADGQEADRLKAWEILKSYKWWIIGIAALAVIVIGGYLFGKYWTSADRQIASLEAAIRTEDALRLASLLHIGDEGTPIDESQAKTIIAYVKSHDLLDDVAGDLKRQADGGEGTSFAVLVKDGSQFGFYQKYRIDVMTSTADVHTNYEGAKIFLDGKEVATADSDDFKTTVGPLVPGEYDLEARYAGEYTTLKAAHRLTATGSDPVGTVDLTLEGQYVKVDSNFEGAAIFIDGTDTGAVTGQDDELGPVAVDGSNKVHLEKAFPWGAVKSEEVPIDEASMRIEIDPNTDAMKETVMKDVSDFLLSWMDAYRKLDASAVRNLSKDQKASLASSIDSYKSSGLVYQGEIRKLVFDTDSIQLAEAGEGVFETAVSLQNTYTQTYYSSGETPPEPQEITDTFTYRLQYVGGKWTVTDWYMGYDYVGEHTKEMTFGQN